jgi:hypothetical protein
MSFCKASVKVLNVFLQGMSVKVLDVFLQGMSVKVLDAFSSSDLETDYVFYVGNKS